MFGDPGNANHIADLIVVGASLPNGGLYYRGAVADWVTCYAPGDNVWVPIPQDEIFPYSSTSGTSIGKCPIMTPHFQT